MSIIEVTKLVNHIDSYIRENTATTSVRHEAISTLLGCVIGTQLSIPSVAVKNVRIHYHDQIYMAAVDIVNTINEAHPIDVDLALEATYLTWYDRYKIVHPSNITVQEVISRIGVMSYSGRTTHDQDIISQVNNHFMSENSSELNAVVSELLTQLRINDGE